MLGKSKILTMTVWLAAAGLLINQALADMNVVRQHMPTAELVGQARMDYLFWKVYNADLYAPDGVLREDGPVALSLNYLRALEGEAIARRSVTEIREQGFEDEETLATWYELMRDIFPDVDKDTRITGVFDQHEKTSFYRNGVLIGEIDDPRFGRHFFGIWLSDKTSQPEFRSRLLGTEQEKADK